MRAEIRLVPLALVEAPAWNDRIVAFDAGPDGEVYVTTAVGLRPERSGRGPAANTELRSPTHYRTVVVRDGRAVLGLTVPANGFAVDFVQPLPDGFLLAASRHYHGLERNARVVNRNGTPQREFPLGDGIASVQATAEGVIWTSSFDEGVYGDDPAGQSGLAAWDARGSCLYEYSPGIAGPIDDCYAMNVASGQEVWIFSYSGMELVRVRDRGVASVWRLGKGWGRVLAVDGEHLLFGATGRNEADSYHLFRIREGEAPVLLGALELLGPDGSRIIAERAAGRGDSLFILSRGGVYQVDVRAAVAAVDGAGGGAGG